MSAGLVHRPEALLCVTAGLWSLVWASGTARRARRVRSRAGALLLRDTVPSGRRLVAVRGCLRRWLPPAGVACAVWLLIGGVGGLLGGAVAGVGGWWWLRRPGSRAGREPHGTDPETEDPAHVARQLPLAADLLAACITAGASPVAAAWAVGESLGGPVGRRLSRGAAQLRLGGEPAQVWRALGALPGAGRLARLLERADESGVPAAVPAARLAAEARAERGRAATERARRAAVMVTVPVGLCFLPAFIAVGVLPVVIGLAGGLLGGGGR
ncbi:membrane protein [Streptomyces ruber]|uniref:Membrane protein n=2 Tax=Streptomyces TaxID=1883 RepID=A0A918BLJ7_9ACTN|nr:type II secretion system F family protein [Streptomyces ruber]GGQ77043.1 membrane protein [Streptomyces ruber]